MLDADRRAELLEFYDGYTVAFQKAYEQFASDPDRAPDPTPALPYYHTPCLFITPIGVAAFATEDELARHFADVIRDMRSKSYQRTDLGPIHLTALSTRCVLLSLVITRVDQSDRRYDEYGVTYTVVRAGGAWRVAVVHTHPSEGVLITDA